MIWLRILAGVGFLVWLGCFIHAMWSALRPLPHPDDWTSVYGTIDPESDEFRRLVNSRTP
jgi:hypothetical protein